MWLKRILDVFLVLLVMVIFAPILIAVAILVHIKLGKPILFTQTRPGLHGKPFKIVKFRTMRDDKDTSGNLRADADRLTQFGQRLRSTSLDELPNLWTIFKGDMSLVGPRPLLMEYLPLYNSEQARRHLVKPGLTGWAQVNGRNAIGWDEKFKFDVWYVDNQSFWLDMKILWMTVLKVIKRQDIAADAHVTMPKFTGNNE